MAILVQTPTAIHRDVHIVGARAAARLRGVARAGRGASRGRLRAAVRVRVACGRGATCSKLRRLGHGGFAIFKNVDFMASVKIYPRAILSTPGPSGFYISYNRVLRAVLQKPLRWGIFYRFQLQHRRACCCSWQRPRAACACLIGEVHITKQSFCCCCCCC